MSETPDQNPAPSSAMPEYDPTDGMSRGELFMAGVGRGMVNTYDYFRNVFGVINDEEYAVLMEERRRLDAPLMATEAGHVGDGMGVVLLGVGGAAVGWAAASTFGLSATAAGAMGVTDLAFTIQDEDNKRTAEQMYCADGRRPDNPEDRDFIADRAFENGVKNNYALWGGTTLATLGHYGLMLAEKGTIPGRILGGMRWAGRTGFQFGAYQAFTDYLYNGKTMDEFNRVAERVDAQEEQFEAATEHRIDVPREDVEAFFCADNDPQAASPALLDAGNCAYYLNQGYDGDEISYCQPDEETVEVPIIIGSEPGGDSPAEEVSPDKPERLRPSSSTGGPAPSGS